MSKEEGLGWPGRAVGGSPGTPLQTAAGGDCGCEKRLAATAGANVCLLGPCPIPGSMPICGKAIYGNPVCIDLSLSVCVCVLEPIAANRGMHAMRPFPIAHEHWARERCL